jgi:hypothetical protein
MGETDPTRLLLEIKGDLGETFGIVSELRTALAEHRHEDRADLHEVKQQLAAIEARQAHAQGVAAARRHGDTGRLTVWAAAVSAAVSGLTGWLVSHWAGH